MENLLENKTKLYFQYFGQKDIVGGFFEDQNHLRDLNFDFINSSNLEIHISDTHLLLKSLIHISDEDAIEVVNFMGFSMTNPIEAKALIMVLFIMPTNDKLKYDLFLGQMLFDLSDLSSTVEKIRSLGYAYKWMGLTVEKQIKYGWIKLITK